MSTVGLSRQIVQMVQFYERRKVQILCLSFFMSGAFVHQVYIIRIRFIGGSAKAKMAALLPYFCLFEAVVPVISHK